MYLNGVADGVMVLKGGRGAARPGCGLDLDTNGVGKLIWAEVRAAWPAFEQDVRAHIQLEACTLPAAVCPLERRIDGAYAALQWQTACRSAAAPAIRYSMRVEVYPTLRDIARLEWPGSASVLRVLVPRSGMSLEASAIPPTAPSPTHQANVPAVPFSVASPPDAATRAEWNDAARPGSAVTATPKTAPSGAAAAVPLQFPRAGKRHKLTAYDHVPLLICRLMPSVMRRNAPG